MRIALVTSVAVIAFSVPSIAGEAAKPVQTVLISFDGAHDVSRWKRSLKLAEETGAKFTYFLNCSFLLSPENKGRFDAPGKGRAKSNVGFGKSRDDVSARLNQIWRAHVSGHEIASHTCGHFDGKDWSAADWENDRRQFRSILANAWTINSEVREPFGWRRFSEDFPKGFRAPYLSVGPGLEQALKSGNYLYDASTVERGIAAPKSKSGIVRFALPLVPEGPDNRRIIAMDYNLFVRHSGGFERPDADGQFEQRTFDMLMNAFNGQYSGKREPVQFGLHFTLMNGGAYWRAAERFASEVCVKPDVRCTTYEDYARQLLKTGMAKAVAVRDGS
jgi:peptidoglycan/xylan/chitin deacetylase (PgdA/CDA1 family)